MSEHNLILEFYKPTYNLDFDYDDDGGLDLHFTNIKGEFFMTMNDGYNSVYIEDEDCEFSKGEMFATVDLGDLVERIINGEFRQTNGKAINDWSKRFIGDGEEQIEFDGKNYADGSLFWDDFFKKMPKDEIKDFMTFCEDYLDLPNIEVDTVSDKYDFENGEVELKSNGKWGITVNDDYTIISVNKFTCNSTDACDAYDVASSESDEDDYYESKKSTRKSLKEGINDDIENYIDDLKTYSKKDVPSYSKSYYFWSYYEFNISDNEWTKVSLSGRDYTKSLKDANNFAKSDDVVKAYLVFKNPNNPNENFKVIIKENDFYESKKSARKSLKENELFSSNTPYEIKINGKKIKSHSDYEVVYDRVENDEYILGIKIKGVGNAQLRFSSKNEAKELGWIINESKKSARKSIKESKVDFQSVIDRVLPKEYAKNKNAYRYALSCVTSLYNEDEYDSDSAKVYFLNCYISDLFPSWVDELGEEEIDAFANALYDGTMKWSDIDSSWFESKKSAKKSLKKYLVKGLDVDFVVDHLLSLEDLDNFDLINKLSDLWEVYKKSWNKFNKSLSNFWEVMKDIEKLDSFDKTCKEIIDAWCDDIEKIFYSDDNLENLKLNYGFEGNDIF